MHVTISETHVESGGRAVADYAVDVDDVTINFDVGGGELLTAVQDCTLRVKPGEFLTVVGPSGCGKTTMLFAIDGLYKTSSGVIRVGGEAVDKPTQAASVVFQDFGLLPWRTVLDNVMLPMELKSSPLRSRSREERREIALRHIESVGLSEFVDRYPRQISGGMKQRVGIARALATGSETLLMDEPYAALDAQTRDLMGADLLHLWNKDRKTVIFVTHNIEEAAYLGDRVAIMTRRPTRVKEIVDIPIPRPRPLEVRETPEFNELRGRIWASLRDEVDVH